MKSFVQRISLNRCKIPECDVVANASYLTSWLNYSTPFESNLPEKCEKFQYVASDDNASCTSDSFNRSVIDTCSRFIYESDETTIQRRVFMFNLWWLMKHFYLLSFLIL
jgi:hypothetical protein